MEKPIDDLDLKKLLSTYLRHWKWFVLSCMFCLFGAFFYLRYATPEYSAHAKIMIMDNDGQSNPAELVLRDLGQFGGSENKMIEDEIEILKSRELMTGVVKKLGLNTEIYVKGRFHDNQYFPNSKAPIKINTIASDSIIYKSNFKFSIRVTSETTFDYVEGDFNSDNEENIVKMHFGKNINTPIGDILVTPNSKSVAFLIDQIVYVKIIALDKMAETYKNTISISPAADGSRVVNLSLNDRSANKSVAIINTLIDEYNRVAIEEKKTISNNTADFINKRIELISSDLSDVDDQIENFKTGNKLTNISSETNLYLQSNAQTEQELANSRTELNKINFMKDQIGQNNTFDHIPSNIGLSDGSVNSLAQKYNELLENRNRLLKSSNEKNPIIVNLDQQLSNLKSSLKESLNNSTKTIGLQIRSLENQSAKISSKIYAVPGQVRKSRDIEREQGIKESLYLYLLQKREEATISSIATSVNAKVIDGGHTNYMPVSPKLMLTYLAAIMLGICIPFAVFYTKNLLDTKIHNKEDLEKEINNITVLGEVPNVKTKNGGLIKRNDRSVLSESFRIIRTNFDYIRRGRADRDYNNVIFVTSTINSEGKSFFSMNMALTLANTNKRVLIIGADIRNPQTGIILDKNNKKKNSIEKIGLTEYLVDKTVVVGEAINTFEVNGNNIDVMLSGKVPPNPAELLMSDRMKPLFDKVSEQYDYVIVDTAPSMLVTDTLLFSQYAGHTIYMTRAGYTEKKILNFAKELYADKKLNGMMLVVNDVKQSNFGYGARYGYYAAPEKKGLFGWFKKGKA